MATTFQQRLTHGEEGEHYVAAFLLHQGVSIAPLYQYKGKGKDLKGPRMHVPAGYEVILPDIPCYKGGHAWQVEVKRKGNWCFSHTAAGDRVNETGCDTKYWRHYLEAARQTNQEVWVYWLQEGWAPTGLYRGEINQLQARGPRVWRSDKHLTLVQHDWLERVCGLDELYALYEQHEQLVA